MDHGVHAIPACVSSDMFRDNVDTGCGDIVPVALLRANKPEGARPSEVLPPALSSRVRRGRI